jgi:NAD-dependent deacetylase
MPETTDNIALDDMSTPKPKLVVFSGAGMSAESGLKTFRDTGGLWEEYNIEEVATPEAWKANPELVLNFYNLRRRQVLEANPNDGHRALVQLEAHYDVSIVTQNIDNLHERAGSSTVLHLHGEILKCRPENDPSTFYPIANDLNLGDTDERGIQLRPHVVWFGEAVPMLDQAAEIVEQAEIVVIVGTSLNVYPAASLIHYAPSQAQIYIVDPEAVVQPRIKNLTLVQAKASIGVPSVVKELLGLKA